MTQRALLIGSETYGLGGCNADVALMREVLTRVGFADIAVLTGSAASRDEILQGYHHLIDSTDPADTVVVYYSGHGGRLARPDWAQRQAAGQQAFLQYIVPFDMAETTAADFRGLLSLELSTLQARLSVRTRNVTTILDCCHSGLMSRNPLFVPKAISRAFPADGALKKLGELELRLSGGFGDGNPHAVRVVACGPDQSAFEAPSTSRPGERHGLLTEALADLLTAPFVARLTWQTVAERLRMAVSTAAPTQRPEVEGPSRRLVFSVDEDQHVGALPVRVSAGQILVSAADVLGVAAGDQYTLLDASGEALGTATVASVEVGEATLTHALPAAEVAGALTAAPLRTTTRHAVSVNVRDQALNDAVRNAIDASPVLTATSGKTSAIGSVSEGDGGLVVADEAGLALHVAALATDPAGVHAAVTLLERVAQACRFRALQPIDDRSRLAHPVEVTISRHLDDNRSVVLAGSGERLFAGDKLSVTVRNLSPAPLYWWLFDIGTDSTIELVTQASPSGRRLEPAGQPGDTGTFGGADQAGLVFPASVPADGGRPETFVVIAADTAQDLSPLRTRGEIQPESPLQQALDAARSGVRNWAAEVPDSPTPRYRVATWDVVLEPSARPRLDEPAFALDERPDITLRILAPRGNTPVPDKVAVRLVALSVLKNRALFRATVRLDAMVITGDGRGGVVATPQTQRFPGIDSGDLLPMDNLLLYVGPVHEFLDIAIWANRDDDKGAELADLLAAELGKPGMQTALTVAGGLVLAAPTAAAGVGAVAAVAELVRVGAQLVRKAVGGHIGLYRTSLLPHQRFGIGRHPPDGMEDAQQIRFAWEVTKQP